MTDRAHPTVQGRCPACGGGGLFLGAGGYVTCPRIGCPAPDAASTVLLLQPGARPVEHCGNQPSEVFTWLHPGQYSECVLHPGHQGSHADQHGMRWWLTTGPVATHPYQGDGHLHPCTQPGPGICGRPEYDHDPITTEA
ncbi:hypothetical protein [Streptomyces sp. NPDC017448]|uniref:hypothetical protein n=1 Tax=Streptomyces sp. NPDC017448 TaxID=3364996 RepID=UPI003791E0F7